MQLNQLKFDIVTVDDVKFIIIESNAKKILLLDETVEQTFRSHNRINLN